MVRLDELLKKFSTSPYLSSSEERGIAKLLMEAEQLK
jgi:hypothetical protein